MNLLTPNGSVLEIEIDAIDSTAWAIEARWILNTGQLRSLQVTSNDSIENLVGDLDGELIEANTKQQPSQAAGKAGRDPSKGSPQVFQLHSMQPPADTVDDSNQLSGAYLGVWSGEESSVFGFFYSATDEDERSVMSNISSYFSGLLFEEDYAVGLGVKITSEVRGEMTVSERCGISLPEYGAFNIMEAEIARDMVPKHKGEQIGINEVWRKDYSLGDHETSVFLGASETTVSTFFPRSDEDVPDGTVLPDRVDAARQAQTAEDFASPDQPADDVARLDQTGQARTAEPGQKAVDFFEKVTHLDWRTQ